MQPVRPMHTKETRLINIYWPQRATQQMFIQDTPVYIHRKKKSMMHIHFKKNPRRFAFSLTFSSNWFFFIHIHFNDCTLLRVDQLILVGATSECIRKQNQNINDDTDGAVVKDFMYKLPWFNQFLSVLMQLVVPLFLLNWNCVGLLSYITFCC